MTADTIIDYLCGDLPDDRAQTFEQDLFAGDLDGADLTDLSTLTVALREAAFLGILSVTVSRTEMERVRAAGYRIVECRHLPGQETVADLGGDFDLLFVEYIVDLQGVNRLDSEVCDHTGTVIKRVHDIPFDSAQHVVSGFCARELALVGIRNNPEGIITRFLSVEPEGDRVLAEYRARGVFDDPKRV